MKAYLLEYGEDIGGYVYVYTILAYAENLEQAINKVREKAKNEETKIAWIDSRTIE